MAVVGEELQVQQLGQSFTCKRGEHICLPGDPCDALYFVQCGSIEVQRVDSAETQQSASVVCSAGQFFGELALADEHPSRWLACALEDSSLLRIGKMPLQRMLHERCGYAGLCIQTLLGYKDQLIFLCA